MIKLYFVLIGQSQHKSHVMKLRLPLNQITATLVSDAITIVAIFPVSTQRQTIVGDYNKCWRVLENRCRKREVMEFVIRLQPEISNSSIPARVRQGFTHIQHSLFIPSRFAFRLLLRQSLRYPRVLCIERRFRLRFLP